MAYALSPAGPVYTGPGASPTQATAEPFTADSPYFPFNTRPGSRLSPAKTKIIPVALRPAKDEPSVTATALDGQWGVVYRKGPFNKHISVLGTPSAAPVKPPCVPSRRQIHASRGKQVNRWRSSPCISRPNGPGPHQLAERPTKLGHLPESLAARTATTARAPGDLP
ncbi:hypothetical protein NQ317_009085 [Molorchus minor]|uniref:Uncharacterized protein n=1 Tax=Molorchus minor TaxID=1323400 RepID=A0ABQ9JE88_9CUCU|nr:hypothetical protein NQ317_009085 [Molorchus minor]